MNTQNNHLVTDQHITQMITSYLARNREMLNSLREKAVTEPLPLIPRRDIAPLLQDAHQ